MSKSPPFIQQAVAPTPLWRRVVSSLFFVLSVPLAIPFLLIMGIGDLLLLPFYPARGPYSGPPAIFRALVGSVVFAILVVVITHFFHHRA